VHAHKSDLCKCVRYVSHEAERSAPLNNLEIDFSYESHMA
jgi:hypothetical protein